MKEPEEECIHCIVHLEGTCPKHLPPIGPALILFWVGCLAAVIFLLIQA